MIQDLGDDSRFIEFYNLVFMQYNKKDDGSLEPLKQKNIDTGLGLERMARILQKVNSSHSLSLETSTALITLRNVPENFLKWDCRLVYFICFEEAADLVTSLLELTCMCSRSTVKAIHGVNF